MISLNNICIRQGDFSLDSINLTIPKGSYGILMGKSGAGKSTLVEIICGLRAPFSGSVEINGKDVTTLKPALRGIGYVPQDEALFKGLSVRENLGIALELRKVSKKIINKYVQEIAEQLQIQHLLERSIAALSGGEQQRTTLGRALVFQPNILLLDEPLSALDEETRNDLIPLLKNITQLRGVTTLHITHNQKEADMLGDHLYQLKHNSMELLPEERNRVPA